MGSPFCAAAALHCEGRFRPKSLGWAAPALRGECLAAVWAVPLLSDSGFALRAPRDALDLWHFLVPLYQLLVVLFLCLTPLRHLPVPTRAAAAAACTTVSRRRRAALRCTLHGVATVVRLRGSPLRRLGACGCRRCGVSRLEIHGENGTGMWHCAQYTEQRHATCSGRHRRVAMLALRA